MLGWPHRFVWRAVGSLFNSTRSDAVEREAVQTVEAFGKQPNRRETHRTCAEQRNPHAIGLVCQESERPLRAAPMSERLRGRGPPVSPRRLESGAHLFSTRRPASPALRLNARTIPLALRDARGR